MGDLMHILPGGRVSILLVIIPEGNELSTVLLLRRNNMIKYALVMKDVFNWSAHCNYHAL